MSDPIASLERKMDAMLAAIARLERNQASDRLMTPIEVAKKYRIDQGEVYALCKAGLIPVRERAAKGGKRGYLIAPKDAERQWGPK